MSPQRASTSDLAAVLFLVLAALVLSWPILAGGYLTYADNAAHIAEIYSLAFENGGGWSDIAFCGFPIGMLHSPLWYGSAAGLVRAGIPAGFLYALALFIGFLAPPLALYFVARRSLRPLTAGFAAYLLLIQRPSLVGLGTPLAGMWTYYIAAALFIALVWRLGREARSARDLVWLGTLVGLIGITHLFLVVPAAVLAAVHLVRSVLRRVRPGALALQAAVALVGILAASAYWLPMVLASETTTFAPQNLSPPMALARLFLPTDVVELVKGEAPEFSARLVLDALPMWGLLVLGVWGAVVGRHRRNDAALYGGWVALVMLVLIAFVAPATNARVFGPVSWRLLYFVRIGAALAAIPALAAAEASFAALARRGVAPAAAVIGLALCLWWGAPLRAETPASKSDEMTEVRELWDWLSNNKRETWGRVYIQDTFMTPPLGDDLGGSHILALTARETGVRQLGPYYGVVPYKTKTWTMGQVGLLYGLRVARAEHIEELRARMAATNATHLVVSDPGLGIQIQRSGFFTLLTRIGRFSVFELRGAVSAWVTPIGGEDGPSVAVDEYKTGRIIVRVSAKTEDAAFICKTSYHPFWRIAGSDNARLSEHSTGLIRVGKLSPGDQRVELSYAPPRWPVWVSAAAWLALLLLSFLPRKRFA
jgi:hypothetical protein